MLNFVRKGSGYSKEDIRRAIAKAERVQLGSLFVFLLGDKSYGQNIVCKGSVLKFDILLSIENDIGVCLQLIKQLWPIF